MPSSNIRGGKNLWITRCIPHTWPRIVGTIGDIKSQCGRPPGGTSVLRAVLFRNSTPTEPNEIQKGKLMSEGDSASASETVASKPTEAQKEIARELWERLAKSRPGPTIKDLIYLARFVPVLSSSAVKTLLGRDLSLDQLKELIQHVPKARDKATNQIIKKFGEELTEDDLRFIFSQTRAVEIGKYLLKKYPNDANLGLAERMCDELMETVRQMRQQETTKDILREIDRRL